MLNNADLKSTTFAQKSIFHTCEPRDTKTKVHLSLIILCFISSLLVAIVFAETGSVDFSLTAKKISTTNIKALDQGRSE